jgi:hypothetical protein
MLCCHGLGFAFMLPMNWVVFQVSAKVIKSGAKIHSLEQDATTLRLTTLSMITLSITIIKSDTKL